MEPLTGKQLGPYRVIAPLGAGGMAAVYQAYQPGMDRSVALKILPRHLAHDPHFVARFQHEAKIIANLQHSHILPVFDFGEADGYTYLVMPYVASGTLADSLHGQPLPLARVRQIIAQLGDALDYAHSRGIVHRDVKPSNVLLDAHGNCLLTDFGIAKIVEGTVQLTLPGGIIGTPAYMSPEQGQGATVDRRSDIYALGVLLYELATGRVPFTAETPLAIVLKHLHDPLPPPRTLNPALPDALERVILKALAKDPSDRYQTAAELLRAVQATTNDQAAPSAPAIIADTLTYDTHKLSDSQHVHLPSSVTPATPIVRRRTGGGWLALGSLAVLALVVIVFGGLWVRASGDPPLPTPANVQTSMPSAAIREVDWTAIGGHWSGPEGGVVRGEIEQSDGLYLYRETYRDFTVAAEVQAEDREASLALRMQDERNGYLVIVVPEGARGANPGIYLAKRQHGEHSFLASSQQQLPTIGEWAGISVRAIGARIEVSVNGTRVIDVSDTSATSFTSGKLGFRIYGDASGGCHANFRDIQLPSTTAN